MLTITHDAAVALSAARAAAGAPDTFGTRFSIAEPPETGEPRLAVTFVERPIEGDRVSEQEGMAVYVAPELEESLPEATIDAKPVDGEPQLILERDAP
jgi:Fe-S cluster assembly iron-binding protein IscA